MCGIAGYYRFENGDEALLQGLCNALRHRGPDNQNHWKNETCGMAHTRLSIIDLSNASHQPMHFENLVLSYNGEIYNYKAIRERLQGFGYVFTTTSDTEVLLKAFHKWGIGCVDQFRGMFAFAVYDQQKDELWLFRDRLGVKPLYYMPSAKGLVFSSEPRALYGLTNKSISDQALQEYFTFGYVGKDQCIFQEIKKLQPGHFLHVSSAGLKQNQYWSLDNVTGSQGHSKAQLEAKLEESFALRMVSDVKVGIFLSGGIDSSLVTALLSKQFNGLNTYTIGFEESRFDESSYAEHVAQTFKTIHKTHTLTAADGQAMLKNFYAVYDEPFADSSGIPTALLSNFVHQDGCKVALSADGGDELFMGYDRYKQFQTLAGKIKRYPTWLRRLIASSMQLPLNVGLNKVSNKNLSHRLQKLKDYLTASDLQLLYQYMISNVSQYHAARLLTNSQPMTSKLNSAFNLDEGFMHWDLVHYLPDNLLVKTDRATMYHGVEGREPMLDHELVEMAFSIPLEYKNQHRSGKHVLREILDKHIPMSVFERPKQGFSIPIFSWLKTAYFKSYFDRDRLDSIDEINTKEVLEEYERYKRFEKQGKDYNIEKMWRILSFLMWYEKYKSN